MLPNTLQNNTLADANKVQENFSLIDLMLSGQPQGTMMNGVITPSVSGNNLTVAIKTLAGSDPSENDPVYVRIGNTIRSITSSLSVTKAAGTNWFNAGGAELATKEIDYFVYLGYNATDGLVIGFARIPYANRYDDFSTTTTNEKYCAISTITTAAAADYYEVVGRFAATLSAGAGYTWTVPTFTASNLIQRPVYTTRELSFSSTITGFSGTPTQGCYYRITNRILKIHVYITGTSNDTVFTFTVPFIPIRAAYVYFARRDNGNAGAGVVVFTTGDNIGNAYSAGTLAAWTSSGTKDARAQNFDLII